MDKTAVFIGTLSEQGDDREYWASKTPAERLQAVEFMRPVMYGYDPATTRLQRVFTIAQHHSVECLIIGGYAPPALSTQTNYGWSFAYHNAVHQRGLASATLTT